LLKMHGSANWTRVDGDIKLVDPTSFVPDLSKTIIPPTWFKDLEDFPFSNIWKQARREVRTSRIMIVVGYSVPQTDLFSRSLFRVEAGSKGKRERLDLLVLVNPDPTARSAFLDLVRDGIEPTTCVLEYESLAGLSTVIGRNIAP